MKSWIVAGYYPSIEIEECGRSLKNMKLSNRSSALYYARAATTVTAGISHLMLASM
jgi:hypothetical protein